MPLLRRTECIFKMSGATHAKDMASKEIPTAAFVYILNLPECTKQLTERFRREESLANSHLECTVCAGRVCGFLKQQCNAPCFRDGIVGTAVPAPYHLFTSNEQSHADDLKHLAAFDFHFEDTGCEVSAWPPVVLYKSVQCDFDAAFYITIVFNQKDGLLSAFMPGDRG